MPETPDFDQIADQITMHEGRAAVVQYVAEQLRLIWNARGAADAEVVDVRVRELVAGEIVGRGIARHVAEVITKLDR